MSKQRRSLTFALSGAAAAALLVVAGAVVVQANAKSTPVVNVDNASSSTAPVIDTEPTPDTYSPLPTPDLEEPTPTRTRKKKKDDSTARTPDTTRVYPTYRPTTKPTPTPTRTKTRKKKKDDTLVEPDLEPTTLPTGSGEQTDLPTKPRPKPLVKNTTNVVALCGSGYKVINQRKLANKSGEDTAMIYLLYHAGQGKNCVVTKSLYVHSDKVFMRAILQVKGGSKAEDYGRFTKYAGPLRLAAKKKCVIWGGSFQGVTWKSGWSHCG